MRNVTIYSLVAWASLLAFTGSCGPAKFEIIRDDDGTKGTSNIETDREFQPKTREESDPTAGVEVVKDGAVITQVNKGTETTIRPSQTTRDGDNSDLSCSYPGIQRAIYRIGTTVIGEVNRTGCEDLAIPYTFNEPGHHVVEIEVIDDEGKNAKSTTSIIVLDPDANTDNADNGEDDK